MFKSENYMSVIKCNCKRCKIYLNDSKIYYSVYCGCEDCRQAAEWGHYKGGPIPEKLQKLIYVRSDIKKIEGKKYMHAYQLRDDARSTRIYCTKCYSIIGIDHPNYKDNVFMLIPQLCKTNLDLSIKPTAAIFMKDYPHQDISMIDDDVLFMKDFKDEGIVKKFDTLMSPLRPEYKKPKGISFIQLIEEVEGVTILNLHQGQKDF